MHLPLSVSVILLLFTLTLPVLGKNVTMPPKNMALTALGTQDIDAQYKLFEWKNCDGPRKKTILDALNDKHKITGIDNVFYTNWHHQATVEYFGEPAVLQAYGYRSKIQTNIRYLYDWGNGWWFQRGQVKVFCGDASMEKVQHKWYCRDKPGKVFYVNRYDKYDGIMFCDSWFDLPSLDDVIKNGKASPDKYDVTIYDNRARHWIIALMQRNDIGTWPGRDLIRTRSFYYEHVKQRKWMSTPSAIKYVAKERGLRSVNGQHARELGANADTWAWWAMSLYVQEKVGDYPHRPLIPRDLEFEYQNLRPSKPSDPWFE